MGSIAYTALRRLTGGASVNDAITRDVPIREAIPNLRGFGSSSKSLSGNRESVLERDEQRFAVTISYVAEADFDAFLMFFASVINEEAFDIDFTGTLASPGTVRTVYMTTKSVTFARLAAGNYRVTFEVVQP